MMINPITAVAIAKAIQADRLAAAEATRRARLARRAGPRRRTSLATTPFEVALDDGDLISVRE